MALPEIPLDAPAILTERGALRPERSIVYNKPVLLLWHYTSTRSGIEPISEAELAGLEKTARRIISLLRQVQDSSSFTPIAWPTPELLRFSTSNPDADFAAISRRLQQAETLDRNTLRPSVLEFRRC